MWGVVGAWREVVGNELREVGKVQISWGLVDNGNEFGCVLSNRTPLANFRQGSYKISFMP